MSGPPTQGRVGINVRDLPPADAVDLLVRADRAGVPAAWLSSNVEGADSLTLLALAAARTKRIVLGTSVAVAYARHPLALLQQTAAITAFAGDRFRLGIGASHQRIVEEDYGIAFDRPLQYLDEYVQILRQAFDHGRVDFAGDRLRASSSFAHMPQVPLYLGAIRPAAYRLAGRSADGAISWATPPRYLREIALPALTGEARPGLDRPRLVGHAFGLVSADVDGVRERARGRLAVSVSLHAYRVMLTAAGHPDVNDGIVSDDLIRDVVVTGDEDQVRAGLQRFFDAGCDEVILTLLPTASDAVNSVDRTLELLAAYSAA